VITFKFSQLRIFRNTPPWTNLYRGIAARLGQSRSSLHAPAKYDRGQVRGLRFAPSAESSKPPSGLKARWRKCTPARATSPSVPAKGASAASHQRALARLPEPCVVRSARHRPAPATRSCPSYDLRVVKKCVGCAPGSLADCVASIRQGHWDQLARFRRLTPDARNTRRPRSTFSTAVHARFASRQQGQVDFRANLGKNHRKSRDGQEAHSLRNGAACSRQDRELTCAAPLVALKVGSLAPQRLQRRGSRTSYYG